MSDYPPIDPTSFDLIIIGTGLPESIIAAAAASTGKSVLHLDPNPFYGSQFASLKPTELSDFLSSHSSPPDCPSSDPATVLLNSRSLFSDVEIFNFAAEIVQKHDRKFELDVSGPRILFCADKTIDTILKSGTNQYMEFKSIEASFIYSEGGVLMNVPDSRSAIFKDKSLTVVEKNKLMKFFKLVQQHFTSDGSDEGRILEEDLERPYSEFLAKMGLPHKIKSIILYSIAMADYDQENMEICKDLLKTRDGIDRLALYQSSLGRFQNAAGAMIYPFHGQGELSQAFCRRAAVKGCIYVLRMPVISLHIDEENRQYKGVKLVSGQDLFSSRLVLGPSFSFPLNMSSSPKSPTMENSDKVSSQKNVITKVARGICITSASLNPGISNLLVVYPPKSLFHGQVTAVRLLQLGSDLAVCPSGMFVLYLSALCDDPGQGKELLNAAISALEVSQSNPISETEDTDAAKPFLLWKALYIQEMASEHQFGSITSTPSPDGNLSFNVLLDTTEKLFRTMYLDDMFFPAKDSSENAENDDGLIEDE